MSREACIAERFRPFGASIFAEMTRLANQHKAVNLSQGFPDFDGPDGAKQAAIAAIHAGHAQYARMIGVPDLNRAIADSWAARGYGTIDPEANVTVTSGCSEAIINTLVGILNPGDEVIFFEPYFDFYTAGAAMAGATPKFVALHPPRKGESAFWLDPNELRAAFTPRTRAILVNTPHNPTGKVFTREELEMIAGLCREHDVIAITDEVYEHLIYEKSLPHIPMATLPEMWDRTITLSSMGKTFSLTGWKVGWAIAPPHLSAGVRAAHQFMTFSTATPLQYGAAAAIREPGDYSVRLRELFASNRDRLSAALRDCGLIVHPSHSTYFLMADHSPLGFADDRAFVTHLIEKIGVAAIPPTGFYNRKELGKPLVRFAFCKKAETMDEAIKRLRALRPAM
ncbi:MAG: aminotransferase class I/II-fold pyridoxal phosphate-dependent enzyme [Planctomycetes bacterium]|nr:aminotransferase class I/II-fold pyridoxal phosphate-dependent enzyme [Planctomycetota bacterium]